MLLGWWGHTAETAGLPWENDSRPAWRHLLADVTTVVEIITTTLQELPPAKNGKRALAKENIAPVRKPTKR